MIKAESTFSRERCWQTVVKEVDNCDCITINININIKLSNTDICVQIISRTSECEVYLLKTVVILWNILDLQYKIKTIIISSNCHRKWRCVKWKDISGHAAVLYRALTTVTTLNSPLPSSTYMDSWYVQNVTWRDSFFALKRAICTINFSYSFASCIFMIQLTKNNITSKEIVI